ncbi:MULTISPECIES: hypothetical protein [Streptomycetaceae]|uniref:Uncharacterized protein n=1 Tax=Streptantibioticus cattleyicolor (strain ATCC 35852 / DSM 46488 / JCM 4925 / NBRC 14057 / NRRL 8057) TaxID=1003195 RepID=F8JPY4_STREN|nr:hypothetical protein [Streptantibioticus cattleyicolor]AEW94040.1 hypothetical protein SCATT_16690 [Streptantibioticus cattleyicolor NRRL 8057 = DSM 46488]MYS58714.1 hypothetical protein [Streptomyces sp. SID5468]CCB74393.1 protein of unknown function [Streptantibioticus cattleyicolor NRRL 8057 = DSM 46488]
MALFNDHIAVWRAPLISDPYGQHRDWSKAALVWSGLGAALPYRRTYRPEPTRETSRSRITVYLPGAVPYDAADRLLINGLWWVSDGESWSWKLGARRYTQIDAKRVSK